MMLAIGFLLGAGRLGTGAPAYDRYSLSRARPSLVIRRRAGFSDTRVAAPSWIRADHQTGLFFGFGTSLNCRLSARISSNRVVTSRMTAAIPMREPEALTSGTMVNSSEIRTPSLR